MGIVFKNNAKTTLASGITDTATSATVADGSVFPTLGAGEYFFCTFDTGTQNEIVKVTARSGNTLTIVRAQDNTTAKAFSSGNAAELRVTAGVLENIQENIAAKSANQTIYSTTTASSATSYDIGIDPGVEANASVFLDGVYQHHDTFSFSGSTLTFDAAPVDGTALEVIVDNLINLQSSNLSVDTFTAADVGGSPQTDFTLSDVPGAETNLIVFVDGVFQNQDSYTFSNNTLTMTDGVIADRVVTVYIINPVNIGTPSDGTITSAKLSGDITFPGDITVTGDVAFDSPTFVVDNANSRVGIGTAAPSTLLDIVGDVKMSADLTVDTDSLHVDSANNRVGIGTGSPSNILDVQTSTTTTGLRFQQTANTNNTAGIFMQNDASDVIRMRVTRSGAGGASLLEGSNSLELKTGGSLGLAIDGSQNVGIGTNSPVSIGGHTGVLTLYGSNATALVLKDSVSEKHLRLNDGDLSVRNSVGDTHLMVLNGGNVGFVTDSPSAQLELEKSNSTAIASGTAPHGLALSYGAADGNNAGLWFSPEFGADQGIAGIASHRVSGYQTDLRFYTNNTNSARSFTERIRINSSGNLGIGSNNPPEKLTVEGGAVIAGATNDLSGSSGIFLDYESNVGYIKAVSWGSQYRELNTFSSKFSVWTGVGGVSERMRIDGSHGDLTLITSHSGGTFPFRVGYGSYASFTPTVVIDDSGRLTVGNASALSVGVIGSKFDGSTQNGIVVETTRDATGSTFIRFNDSDSAAIGSIYQNGASTVLYATSSDYRLKENVIYDWTALDRLNQLKPARFNFIADADTTVDGFLAHEVQDIVPEAIMGIYNEIEVWKEGEELPEGVNVGDNKTDEDGNTIPVYQGIDQSKLVPLLVKAVQEQQEQIEQLKGRIEELENG